MTLSKRERTGKILREAWVGDAVLSLWARERILAEEGCIDDLKFTRMTSNRFLAGFGEASEVEAEIGRLYKEGGLAAAFKWIEERLWPAFLRQELNRLKR
jgi:hypothetical protein